MIKEEVIMEERAGVALDLIVNLFTEDADLRKKILEMPSEEMDTKLSSLRKAFYAEFGIPTDDVEVIFQDAGEFS